MSKKNYKKLTDKEVITLFVKYIATQDNPGLKVDNWPDEKNRTSTDIDAIAGCFAIEHTSVDFIPNQRRDADWFLQVVKSLEDEFCNKLKFRLVLTFPYECVRTGQDWSRITAAIRKWVMVEAPKLPIGRQVINNVPKIPFKFYAVKKNSSKNGLLFGRFIPEDNTFSDRLRNQLDRKISKLKPYKEQNKTTILLIESDDIALMDDAIMWDELKSTYPDGLPNGLDQIWYADTAILEEILFFNLSQAVAR